MKNTPFITLKVNIHVRILNVHYDDVMLMHGKMVKYKLGGDTQKNYMLSIKNFIYFIKSLFQHKRVHCTFCVIAKSHYAIHGWL